MGRAVLLLHEEPGGEIHYDWMIEGGASEGLVTFRVAERIDSGGDGEFAAKRIGEARRGDLGFEGRRGGGGGGGDPGRPGRTGDRNRSEGPFPCPGSTRGAGR